VGIAHIVHVPAKIIDQPNVPSPDVEGLSQLRMHTATTDNIAGTITARNSCKIIGSIFLILHEIRIETEPIRRNQIGSPIVLSYLFI